MDKAVRTRMAPSPTGEYHIGHIRTLLYNYAYAKQKGGKFILRIEDTDRKRFVKGAQEKILQVIRDYGFTWDEGPDIGGPYAPYVQTERLKIYQKYIDKLLDCGGAYYCFCSEDRLEKMRELQKTAGKIPKYDKKCLGLSKEEIEKNIENKLPYVVRLNIPSNQVIKITDEVRGEIIFNTNDIDDQILVKSNGIPTYHFAAGIDDHLMDITHVLRGDEWISSLPKQYTIYKYLGWELPKFAHLTVFLDPAGGKMSKRHGSVSARSFLEAGYLPDATLNYLMLLGWNPGTEQEIFNLDEFIKVFSIEKLHTKQPVFDRKKLDYFNGYYIRHKDNAELLPYFKKFLPQASDDQITALIPVLKDRLVKFGDLPVQTKFLFEDVDYEADLLLQRGADKNLAKTMLRQAKVELENLEMFEFDQIQEKLTSLIKINGWNVGQFFMIFRVAICGVTQTPPVVECLPILGRNKTLNKIELALAKLK